ncbi:Phosphomevalonate kinase [Streptococcus sp. DD10]|uniref:phosphomevalonate kinase n=1 Tax=Streptococcus sp. DD10 TaxID=1777878 RepID=UPI00079959E2|nr:phosphomevalonate kinase [Streptococcus sp. DD10]KXT74783.1 Phosphomevalonate kinase [Streptococcus sp. DD10]
MTKLRVQTGGKLYLAGEYSVLTPGQSALIAFIPIYMQAEIQFAEEYLIQSDLFDFSVTMQPQADYSLIQETISVMEEFLFLNGKRTLPLHLSLTGKFERDGKKFGIGSSGSVVVLTIKAMASLYQFDLSPDLLFRLSSLVLIRRGDNGSMGDLACIAYEQLVYYQSFCRDRIAKEMTKWDLLGLLDLEWGYVIEPVQNKLTCDFLVGWTEEPAISSDLVRQIKSAIYSDFLAKTQKAVLLLREAISLGDKKIVKHKVEEVSQLLISLSPQIYTKRLARLKESEINLDVIAKSSGAGGGDCGIALSFDSSSTTELLRRWEKEGITLLYKERMGLNESKR